MKQNRTDTYFSIESLYLRKMDQLPYNKQPRFVRMEGFCVQSRTREFANTMKIY